MLSTAAFRFRENIFWDVKTVRMHYENSLIIVWRNSVVCNYIPIRLKQSQSKPIIWGNIVTSYIISWGNVKRDSAPAIWREVVINNVIIARKPQIDSNGSMSKLLIFDPNFGAICKDYLPCTWRDCTSYLIL